MTIPQEALEGLEEQNTDGLFDEHTEDEDEKGIFEPEKIEEEKVSESTEKDSVADKARVPYSRFETVNERAIRAEERLKVLEEQLENSKKIESNETITPEEWTEMYGDSDAAQRAWQLQEKLTQKMREETTNKVLDEIERRQSEKQNEVEKNLNYIEDNLSKFQESLGRNLTEVEESAILDIQDEFTPKDEDGNYIAPLLSPEKAFEVYTLRQSGIKAEKSQARRRVVSITGTSSEGESSNSPFDNYRPGVSGLWRDKL